MVLRIRAENLGSCFRILSITATVHFLMSYSHFHILIILVSQQRCEKSRMDIIVPFLLMSNSVLRG